MGHRIAPRAETDLDDIWVYIARESGSMEIATRLIDSITDRFFLLARFPYLGTARSGDLGPETRTFPVLANTSSCIASRKKTC
jgi:plasmid stabilization system protein ParE